MRKLKNFLEWMDEETVDLDNVSLSLHGTTLFVKGENGDFDLELTDDQVADLTEKMQSMADGAGGEDEGLPEEEPEELPDEEPSDEEDQVAPSVGGVGRLSGM